MYEDPDHWNNLKPPLAPSQEDVDKYVQLIGDCSGSILLLGSTKELLPLVDVYMDIYPNRLCHKRLILGDWVKNEDFYDVIILDGGLCFTKELCDNILRMCQKCCNKFIARCFNYKLDIMKYAQYFPREFDFVITPTFSSRYTEYTFYVWEFQRISRGT